MQFQPITLARVTAKGKTGVVKFKGRPLGRSLDKPTNSVRYQKSVEIYLTEEGSFIIYVTYQDKDGDFALADFAETKTLDLGTVIFALKEAGIYPGPMFSEAIYHSFDTLELLS